MLGRKLAPGDVDDVCIRLASLGDDLDLLVESLEQWEFFSDRLHRQECGNGALLTAWWDGHPIGDAYLWLEEAEEPELRKYLPGVPLLTHVEIREDCQSLGVGTRLIVAAEQELIKRKYKKVALAVEKSNVRAAKLYSRLGYRRWRHPEVPYVYCESFGDGDESLEICHVMIKDL
jgi:GNAT superfamily N-acetyltransferase